MSSNLKVNPRHQRSSVDSDSIAYHVGDQVAKRVVAPVMTGVVRVAMEETAKASMGIAMGVAEELGKSMGQAAFGCCCGGALGGIGGSLVGRCLGGNLIQLGCCSIAAAAGACFGCAWCGSLDLDEKSESSKKQ